MFKISFAHDILNPDPKLRKKITAIVITYGYACNDSRYCNCQRKCKYSNGGYWFHNLSCKIHLFFEYRLHIKLPHLLYIGKKHTSLSGTTKCPFHKSRHYTCWDCKYSDGQVHGSCLNEKYRKASYEESRTDDPEWNSGKCKFFEKNEWADDWDKETGEMIYG